MSPEQQDQLLAEIAALSRLDSMHKKRPVRMCVDFIDGEIKKIVRYDNNNGEHVVSYVAGKK